METYYVVGKAIQVLIWLIFLILISREIKN